jgi:hypothetical protein
LRKQSSHKLGAHQGEWVRADCGSCRPGLNGRCIMTMKPPSVTGPTCSAAAGGCNRGMAGSSSALTSYVDGGCKPGFDPPQIAGFVTIAPLVKRAAATVHRSCVTARAFPRPNAPHAHDCGTSLREQTCEQTGLIRCFDCTLDTVLSAWRMKLVAEAFSRFAFSVLQTRADTSRAVRAVQAPA